MEIFSDNPPEFNSWDQVVLEAKQRNIHCPDVTNRRFINSLRVLQSVSHSSIFSKPSFDEIHALLNQIKNYQEGNHFSFVDEVYGISKLIKLVKKKKNSKALFKQNIFKDRGMFNQFLITAYLCKKLKVIDMEINNSPINSDLKCKLGQNIIYFQIKDSQELKREQRRFDAIWYIDCVLTNRAKARDAKKRLAVSKFIGTPPQTVQNEFWEKLAREIDEKPQTKFIKFPPGQNTSNETEVKVKVTFVWRDYNGVFNSAGNGFNNFLKVSYEYEKLNESLKKANIPIDDVHILVAITEDKYDWQKLEKSIKNEQLGLVIIELIEFNFLRSPFMLPENHTELAKKLNNLIPENVEFVFN